MKISNIKKKLNKKYIKNYLAKCNYIKYYKNLKINEKIILLESQQGKEFGGNIYYIAQELSNNSEYKDYIIYFSIKIGKKKAAEKFYKGKKMNNIKFIVIGTDEYFRIISTAKYLINDNTFLPFFVKKEGQIYLNTWHGTPLKCLGKKIKDDFYNIGNTQKNFIIADYLLYPNEYTKEHMLEDYMVKNLSNNKVILEGYPRNTAFFDKELKKEIIEELDLEDKQVIAYMPTWRGTLDGQNSTIQKANLEYILEEIDDNLDKNQILYVNLHPIEKAKIDFSKYKRVKEFPIEYETYEFLNIADVLVTDYSSVFFDFLNTRKKIILYTYDEESYIDSRGVYFELSNLPFTRVNTIKELLKEIKIEKQYDDSNVLNKFCKYDNKNATKKICEKVILNRKNDIVEYDNKGNGKKNILIFGGKLALNGITTSLKNLIMNIDKEKYNYYIIVESKAVKNSTEQLYELSQYVDFIFTKGKMNLTLSQKLLFFIYKNKLISTNYYMKHIGDAYETDIKRILGNAKFNTIIHFSGYAYKKILLFSKIPCKRIIYAHSDMYQEGKIKKNIRLDVLRYAYKNYDEVALVTEDLLPPMKKLFSKKTNVKITNNIIDYKKILSMAKDEVKLDINTLSTINVDKLTNILNSKSKKFINISRFSIEKGQERLIKAFERLWREDDSIFLIIIGGKGKEYKNIINQVNNSICKDNIIIIREVSNPFAILNKCDYFVLSSFYEGFGLVIAEADILGKPVISTRIVGPTGFMEEHGGTLVENSEDGIYNGMKLLLDGKVKPMNVNYEEYNKKAIKQFENLF